VSERSTTIWASLCRAGTLPRLDKQNATWALLRVAVGLVASYKRQLLRQLLCVPSRPSCSSFCLKIILSFTSVFPGCCPWERRHLAGTLPFFLRLFVPFCSNSPHWSWTHIYPFSILLKTIAEIFLKKSLYIPPA
jgi:hypothetical protein